MSKVKAYCKGCKKMIDITDMPFISYADEEPNVLDIQLPKNATEEDAIAFVKKHGIWNFKDWGDGNEEMFHYDRTPSMSHYEAGDDVHTLKLTGGYWSTL